MKRKKVQDDDGDEKKQRLDDSTNLDNEEELMKRFLGDGDGADLILNTQELLEEELPPTQLPQLQDDSANESISLLADEGGEDDKEE